MAKNGDSWEGMREGVTDKQPAAESVRYINAPDFVEEHLIRDEGGRILGKLIAKQLLQPDRTKQFVSCGIRDDRPDEYVPPSGDEPKSAPMSTEQLGHIARWVEERRKRGDDQV